MKNDPAMKSLTDISMGACALIILVIFFAGWRSDEAATVFVVCLGYLTLFGLARG